MRFLDHGYEDARQLLIDCGFTTHDVLTDEGFTPDQL